MVRRLSVAALTVALLFLLAMFAPFGSSSVPAFAADCTPADATYSSNGVTYQVLVFKNSSSCDWTVPDGITSVDVLVVGGGGAGGGLGGGGAGEFVEETAFAVSGTIAIVAGAGGPRSTSTDASNRNGSPSSFGSITASGGGGGGLGNGGDGAPGVGGASGGGAARGDGSPGASQDDGISTSFGNSGAEGWGLRNPTVGGAGGGAGAAALNATVAGGTFGESYVGAYPNDDAGVVSEGGDGKTTSIIPAALATTLSVGEVSGSDVYFAGGGGGGCGGTDTPSGCVNAALSGGLGGGGDGSNGAGTDYTGGGGAGANSKSAAGGAGGAGVVIVSFVLSVSSDDSASGSSNGSSNTGLSVREQGSPGIFLTVAAKPGSALAGSRVIFGSFAVKPGSPYVLTIGLHNATSAPRVLAQGFVSDGGHLEKEVYLPFLPDGNYLVVFSGTSTVDSPLRLANLVGVGENGLTNSVTPEALQPFVR